ncbi:hypothetical protein PV11_03590 [Exophiala sideris]|uniref:Uncharacterized protein n=1 Tax=Exophiala sideris TaxID=1016849 RepID=A0A0D1YK64_9EURO|nr:hypothetical protein PV11_03590 [Exophiala sideris]
MRSICVLSMQQQSTMNGRREVAGNAIDRQRDDSRHDGTTTEAKINQQKRWTAGIGSDVMGSSAVRCTSEREWLRGLNVCLSPSRLNHAVFSVFCLSLASK